MDVKAVEIANIYSIRLKIKSSEKENYTKEEILDFLDDVVQKLEDEE